MSDAEPKSEAERLNALMRAVGEGWGYVPLSVREKAARLADAFVSAWNAETVPPRKASPNASQQAPSDASNSRDGAGR